MLRFLQEREYAVKPWSEETREYGRGARVMCPNCGITAYLKRRIPHPTRGSTYELQTFVCQKCGSAETREVFTPGAAGLNERGDD